jgi:two-component system response regulator NreC
VRIVVIEDQAMVRGLLVRVCRQHPKCGDVMEASDGEEGVRLARRHAPDVVLLDLELPDGDGLDRLDELRKAAPGAKVIVVTSHNGEYVIHRAIQEGVAAFVDKCGQSSDVVTEAIDAVLRGRTFYSPVVAKARARMREDPNAFTKLLSDREQRVLCLLGAGLSNEQVAERLGVSAGTVHAYRRNIMFKLGIHSTPALIHYALEKGFTFLRPPAATT